MDWHLVAPLCWGHLTRVDRMNSSAFKYDRQLCNVYLYPNLAKLQTKDIKLVSCIGLSLSSIMVDSFSTFIVSSGGGNEPLIVRWLFFVMNRR